MSSLTTSIKPQIAYSTSRLEPDADSPTSPNGLGRQALAILPGLLLTSAVVASAYALRRAPYAQKFR